MTFGLIDEIFGTQIRGHDDKRIAEINRATLAIGQPTVIKHLQKHIENIRMRLFDFVKEKDLIGPAPHRFGECATFFIADITRRRADQTRNGMFLHIFGHIDTHHRRLVIKQIRRKRFGEFGFTDTGWS